MTALEFIFFVLPNAYKKGEIAPAEMQRILDTLADFVGLYGPADGKEPEAIQKLCEKMHRILARMERAAG